MELEKTSEAMRDFRAKTANIKAIQPNLVRDAVEAELMAEVVEETVDPFADDTPLACGLENPEACEACN